MFGPLVTGVTSAAAAVAQAANEQHAQLQWAVQVLYARRQQLAQLVLEMVPGGGLLAPGIALLRTVPRFQLAGVTVLVLLAVLFKGLVLWWFIEVLARS